MACRLFGPLAASVLLASLVARLLAVRSLPWLPVARLIANVFAPLVARLLARFLLLDVGAFDVFACLFAGIGRARNLLACLCAC